MATTPNYSIDYNDKRFQNVEKAEKAALSQSDKQYDKMVSQSDQAYQGLIDATEEYGKTQSKLQQEQTDFTIEKIEQQKDQANKDYIKEQQGAYVDWQKQSNQYGAGAEQMAAQGLHGTGYSESSQVQMYTAYQNRVAVGRETYNNAVLNYNNSIKEAMLANNSALAEIAFNTLQTTLSLGLEKVNTRNQLLTQKLDAQREIDNTYYARWQDVLAQMNQENAMAEEIRQYEKTFAEEQRQYNESMALEKEQMKIAQQQWEKEYALQEKQFKESIRQFDTEIARLRAKDTAEARAEAKRLELEKKQMEQEQKRWEAEMAEEKRQFDASLELEKKNLSKSSSGSGSSGSGGYYIDAGDDPPSGGSQSAAYSTFQTNIANMMMKNPKDSTINSMAKSIESAYNSGKLTKSEAQALLAQLY